MEVQTSTICFPGKNWSLEHLNQNFKINTKSRMPQELDMKAFEIFGNLKPIDMSKSDSNIICLSSKNTFFFKITRMWLKNWASHAHFNFEI